MYQGKHSRAAVLAERQRGRRNKKLTVLASLALAGILSVGGTIAWVVTSSAEVENAFAPTSVSSQVVEDHFENGKDTTKKNVRVKNTGTTDAFVRAAVLVNWMDADGNLLGVEPDGTHYQIGFNETPNGEGERWVYSEEDDFWYWTGSVAPGEETDVLISSCELVKNATVEGYSLSVEIVCSVIQSKGVTGNDKAVVAEMWDSDSIDIAVNGDSLSVMAQASTDE